jgi:hypothetical protein
LLSDRTKRGFTSSYFDPNSSLGIFIRHLLPDSLQTSVNGQSTNVAKSPISTGIDFAKPCQCRFERAGVGMLQSQGETKKKIAGCAQLFAHFGNSDTRE